MRAKRPESQSRPDRVSRLSLLTQGRAERDSRVLRRVGEMDAEAFRNHSNHPKCEAVWPKAISLGVIARMRRDCTRATIQTRAGFRG